MHLVHRDRNYIYNFWPREGESIAQAWGRLNSMLYSCPNHELSREIIIQKFYARLSRNDQTMLDTSCVGSFMKKNIEYEIPSGMIEQILANPFAGDGTEHPDMHLIYVEQICGLFKLAGLPRDEVMKKFFPLSLKVKALAWYRLCDDIGSWNWNRLELEFHRKFILCI